MPVLYVIATPIGNLEDISLRALRILQEVKLIAAEDTRTTRHLLSAHNIKTPLTSYHEHSKRAKLDYLLNYLEKEDLALVSEAGMPGLSDPGYELIVAAIEHGISVVPIPGVSAVITALVVSGLPTDQFLYVGFLPRRKGQRQRLLSSIVDEPRTIVAFETPHRLREALNDIVESLGNRRISVCRELTKVHEEIFRGRVNQAREHFAEPRGEFTLVIEGKTRAWLKFQERS
jgi:16S rRNA (cytidine1402-2'-O)-methyltransferase